MIHPAVMNNYQGRTWPGYSYGGAQNAQGLETLRGDCLAIERLYATG